VIADIGFDMCWCQTDTREGSIKLFSFERGPC